MFEYIQRLQEFFDKNGDPRVSDYPFMSNPLAAFVLISFYVYFVKDLGPKLMRNRKPFDLKKTLIVYNLFQVVLSFYIFYEMGMSGWFGKYNYHCQPVDYSNSADAMRMLHVSVITVISKYVDLLDTVFFVLRKKFDQVSILHVIHHSIMPISLWFGLKFVPGGHGTFLAFVNSFVHVFMYGYYFLSAFGPAMQKYLWWKKYLTVLQLVQMLVVCTHAFQLLVTDCNYPRAFVWAIGLEAIMFYFLFRDFYRKAYEKRKSV